MKFILSKNIVILFTLSFLLIGCVSKSITPEQKAYMSNVSQAQVVSRNSTKIGYNGPSANISSALFYDYSDKSHWYTTEIEAVKEFLDKNDINLGEIITHRFQLRLSEQLGISAVSSDSNEKHPTFEVTKSDFNFTSPHAFGNKVSPQFLLEIKLVDENNKRIFNGPGIGQPKFSGEGRFTLEDWLSDKDRFLKYVNQTADQAANNFLKFYAKQSK